jgi:hypothetical protein
MSPLEKFKMAAVRSQQTNILTQGAALAIRPPEKLKVSASCRNVADIFFHPGAALGAGPLQNRKVATVCGRRTDRLVQGAARAVRPLQKLEVTASGCAAASIIVPGAALVASPL